MTPTGSHAGAVRALVAAEPSRPGDKPAGAGQLQRLCRAARRDLPASGVGVSVLSEGGALLTAAASSQASARIEELQFALGEGPCFAAISARNPVLVPDLSVTAATTWPGYAPAARDHGVRAVFAFPMLVGGTGLGVLDVYRDQPGALSNWAQSRAQTYADAAMDTILETGQDTAEMATLLTDGSETRLQVYQAQGMLIVQLGVGPDEALARMRAHAFAEGRSLGDVADDIIARRLVLESDDPDT